MSHLLLTALSLCAAGTPASGVEVVRLETQRVGTKEYFLVALRPPKGAKVPALSSTQDTDGFSLAPPGDDSGEADRRGVMQFPRLRPDDARTAAVHFAGPWGEGAREGVFLGRRTGKGATARLRLSYPEEAPEKKGVAGLPGDRASRTVEVELVWKTAKGGASATAPRRPGALAD
jgi:hypothetical protein